METAWDTESQPEYRRQKMSETSEQRELNYHIKVKLSFMASWNHYGWRRPLRSSIPTINPL